jgi:hypothetical protein
VRNQTGNYDGKGKIIVITSRRPKRELGAYELAAELPRFLIVGPPRTGTSWLHAVLREHANLPSPTKETRFFDLHFEKGINWYLCHYPKAIEGHPRGEIAPTYFGSSRARERIAQLIPDVKLAFIFRNPVDRLISLYRLKRAYGMHNWTLEEALARDPEMIESSLYAKNLRLWQASFPAEQLSINLFDDLNTDPQGFVDRLTGFLGIRNFKLTDPQLNQVFSTKKMTEPRSYLATRAGTRISDWCKARRLDSIVARVRESGLLRLFIGGGAGFTQVPESILRKIWLNSLTQTEELEGLLGRDLSDWKRFPTLQS